MSVPHSVPRQPRHLRGLLNLGGALLVHLLAGLFGVALLGSIYARGSTPAGLLGLALAITSGLWLIGAALIAWWWRSHPRRVWLVPVIWGLTQFAVLVGVCPSCKWASRTGEGPDAHSDFRIGVGRGPQGVAVGENSVWVTNTVEGTVSQIDPHTSRVTATIRVGRGPT